MAYAMAVNLFLTGVEAFKEFYAGGEHAVFTQFYYFGIGEHRRLVPYAWMAVACDVAAFLLLLIPAHAKERRHVEPGLPAHLRRDLHREGDRPADPRLHARTPSARSTNTRRR